MRRRKAKVLWIFDVGGIAMYFLLKAVTDSSGNDHKENVLHPEKHDEHQWHSFNRYAMKIRLSLSCLR